MSIDKDMYYMNLAFAVAEKSKCIRAQYGTVIVSEDDRVVATGYNGKPKGCINDHVCYREGLEDNASKPNCCLHSEVNALLFSSPLDRKNGTAYVNGIPCTDCALMLANSGIKRVVYFENSSGHRGNLDQEFINKYGIKVEFVNIGRITPESVT